MNLNHRQRCWARKPGADLFVHRYSLMTNDGEVLNFFKNQNSDTVAVWKDWTPPEFEDWVIPSKAVMDTINGLIVTGGRVSED